MARRSARARAAGELGAGVGVTESDRIDRFERSGKTIATLVGSVVEHPCRLRLDEHGVAMMLHRVQMTVKSAIERGEVDHPGSYGTPIAVGEKREAWIIVVVQADLFGAASCTVTSPDLQRMLQEQE